MRRGISEVAGGGHSPTTDILDMPLLSEVREAKRADEGNSGNRGALSKIQASAASGFWTTGFYANKIRIVI